MGPLTGTEGTPINGQVATYASSDVLGTNPQATIAWGDGHTSPGTIANAPNNALSFIVDGVNTYAVPGTYPVTVTISSTGATPVTATGTATIAAVSPLGTATTITAVAGVPFTGVVASFTDSYPSLTAAGYSASINWGDGNSSVGTVVANAQGGFNVVGTNVYQQASTSVLPVTVTIVRAVDGNTVTVKSSASVVNGSNVLSGQISPLSVTGASSSTEVFTAINQPTFDGTALPYAIVQLFGRRSDQAQPVLLGQAVTSATGIWQISVGALPDGVYSFSVAQIPPTGLPTTMALLTPGIVVIDTATPNVLTATSAQSSGQIDVAFKDNISGLDTSSLTNPLNYTVTGRHKSRIHPSSVTIVPNTSIRSADPVSVALEFRGVGKIHSGQTIVVGGITDLAGRKLPKESLKVTQVTSADSTAQRMTRISARLLRHGQ